MTQNKQKLGRRVCISREFRASSSFVVLFVEFVNVPFGLQARNFVFLSLSLFLVLYNHLVGFFLASYTIQSKKVHNSDDFNDSTMTSYKSNMIMSPEGENSRQFQLICCRLRLGGWR